MKRINLIRNELNNSSRCHTLDTIRGIALISMILYHTCFDMVYFFGWFSISETFDFLWQQSICYTFLLVSGATLCYSKRPIRRSFIIIGAAYLLTLGTFLFMRDEIIVFGVLHCIGFAMLIIGLLKRPLDKINSVVGLIIFFILFALTRYIHVFNQIGFFRIKFFSVPEKLYSLNLYPLGLQKPDFVSGDYYPLIPWTFLILTGYYLWKIVLSKNKNKNLYTKKIPFFTLVGENTLLVYVLHQPIVYGILYLINMLI